MPQPRIILGISDSHDAGVAVIRDGQVLAALNEERLCRKKQAAGFPVMALERIWDIAGISPQEIHHVALAGSSLGIPPLNNDFSHEDGAYSLSQNIAELLDRLPISKELFSHPITLGAYRSLLPMLARLRSLRARSTLKNLLGIDLPVETYDHHDAHIASAYFASGMDHCLVISNDGFGDGLCSKIAIGQHLQDRIALSNIAQNSFFNSLGVYYNYVTLFCGFKKAYHAGKTTGLAAFGDPHKTLPIFQKMIHWDASSGRYVNRGGVFRNCLRRLFQELQSFSREDVAAGIQKHCEDILVQMVAHFVATSHCSNVALVGGVHANVKSNQYIAAIPCIENLFVFPHMGDGGLALGAAYLSWHRHDLRARSVKIDHVYWGTEFKEKEIEALLKSQGVAYSRPSNLALEIAKLLQNNKIVARCDGAMEYGPRALGNRSILYPATKPEVNQWLNQQLHRTEFMPFAPVVREKDAHLFFKNYDAKTAHTSQFMTITYDVTERCKREAPAITHIDGTARPQVLSQKHNPDYYAILDEYHRLTGLSILVNTSFNMHDEPIVHSPQDALKSYFEGHLDVLVLGPFLIQKQS
ncbi:MAG: carbamoyltransferase [Verrucomicrobiota bacterium]